MRPDVIAEALLKLRRREGGKLTVKCIPDLHYGNTSCDFPTCVYDTMEALLQRVFPELREGLLLEFGILSHRRTQILYD